LDPAKDLFQEDYFAENPTIL